MFILPHESDDMHLWLTVLCDDMPMALRYEIARQLLHNPSGLLRSWSYWWIQRQQDLKVCKAQNKPAMTPKQQYKLAYGLFRQTKGNACTSSTVARQNAYRTWSAQFGLEAMYSYDPVKCLSVNLYLETYGLSGAQSRIKQAYRFMSDFHLSKVSKL